MTQQMKAVPCMSWQSAGLIKLDTKDGQLANVSNIKENPKDLKISELMLLKRLLLFLQ